MKKPVIIGIAGGSASGKTSVARRLVETFDDTNTVTIIRQDDYYHDQSHLTFLFIVRQGPQAADDGARILEPGVLRHKALPMVHLHIVEAGGHLGNLLHALLHREKGLFGGIDHHADDQLIEDAGGPLDEIQMPQGDRVKAAGINGDLHGYSFLTGG